MQISDEQFRKLVEEAVAAIPPRYAEHLENVAFMVADRPTPEQLAVSDEVHNEQTMLLGLYEGIPLPRRDGGYNGVVPDIITVFKAAHEATSADVDSLRRQIRETVWHEVAHYFGLDHGQIDALAGEDDRA